MAVTPLTGCAWQPGIGNPAMVKVKVPVAAPGTSEIPGSVCSTTVAVNVTVWPTAAVGDDDVTCVVVASRGPSPIASPVHTLLIRTFPWRCATPVARSIRYLPGAVPPPGTGPTPSTAWARPTAGAFEVPTRIAGAISNPTTLPKFSGLPFSVTGMPMV